MIHIGVRRSRGVEAYLEPIGAIVVVVDVDVDVVATPKSRVFDAIPTTTTTTTTTTSTTHGRREERMGQGGRHWYYLHGTRRLTPMPVTPRRSAAQLRNRLNGQGKVV